MPTPFYNNFQFQGPTNGNPNAGYIANGYSYDPIFGQGQWSGGENGDWIPGALEGYRVTQYNPGQQMSDLNGVNYDLYNPQGQYQNTGQWSGLTDTPWWGGMQMLTPFLMAGGMAGLQAAGLVGGANPVLGAEIASGTSGMGGAAPSLAQTVGNSSAGTYGSGANYALSSTPAAPGTTSGLGLTSTGSGLGLTPAAGAGTNLVGPTVAAGSGLSATVGANALLEGAGLNPLSLAHGTGSLLSGNPYFDVLSNGTVIPNSNGTGGAPGPSTGGSNPTGTPPVPPPGGGTSGNGMGNLAALLAALASANTQDDSADELLAWLNAQQAKIDGMYAPGSPEHEAMKQEMERLDAASGRNSQYGVRATDLAGRITGIKGKLTADMTQGIAPYMAFGINQDNNQYAGLWDALAGMDNSDWSSIWNLVSSIFS